ncbi:heparinase II/III family protein [Oricola sp.]|uniref:heparinase II/III family protein n=1 Tax=Oricola sp. TaxID=1979950 RepID=UPI003BA9757C
MSGPGQFRFLNEDGALAAHGWDDPAKAKLWRYNQHYFDDLNADNADARTKWHVALIEGWIADNSPGSGTGWEPYPTSLRIVNWVKWSLAGNRLSEGAQHSLAVQARWLMRRLEWHLLGNHLFANAKALVFAGLFFKGDEAQRWLEKGCEILRREIREQILADGGQFELSPMYHALALEDVLDLVNIGRACGRDDLANAWSGMIPSMLDWLSCMSHPDGRIAFFNDAAFGNAPDNAELAAYARRLGFKAPEAQGAKRHLSASGYARLENSQAVLIADLARVGPDYLLGHAHADTLSFECSLGGRRLIVNSGTSVYGVSPERLRQRGTAAHSTLCMEGRDSSEVWSGFRVGRRARPFDVSVKTEMNALVATAAHDGYRHLPGRPVHRRSWNLSERSLLVGDSVEGSGRRRMEARFHLGSGLKARPNGRNRLDLLDETGNPVAVFIATGGEVRVEQGTWHPEFGESVPNQCIVVFAQAGLPHLFSSTIAWEMP